MLCIAPEGWNYLKNDSAKSKTTTSLRGSFTEAKALD